ncbi:MAG: hypothetical protein IPN22_10585 [Bacteroidetes bacterium]|nr:hypothetical protein [Bacteroidota bacterium]
MAYNTDQEMRSKLQGFEAPMDPAAWQQMEAMLNQKKKRRAIFWWWLGGTAAAVVVAGALLYMQLAPALQQQPLAQNSTSATVAQTLPPHEVPATKAVAPAVVDEPTDAPKQHQHQAVARMKHPTRMRKQQKRLSELVSATQQESPFVRPSDAPSTSSPFAAYEVADGKEMQHRLEEAALLQQARQQQTNIATEEAVASASESSLQKLFVSTDSTATTTSSAEKTTQKKSPVFRYQLGVAAQLSGTSVGGGNGVYRTPSFAAGITQEFLFMNRFALTTGLHYAQTSFRIGQPLTDSAFAGNNVYNHYTTQLQELNIPMGIKVYAWQTEQWRVFVHTGIIHHVKLREQFVSNITSPPSALVNIPPGTPFDNTNVTNSNPFGTIETADLISAAQKSATTEADYFGIRGQKRYYTSLYVSCGVEVVLRKRLHLVAEPMYQLLLHKIGRQPNLRHQFGLTAGFKYTFWK